MQLVECSRKYWDIKVIPSKYLIRRIDEFMSPLVIFLVCQVILYFFEVNGWNPSISINDCQEYVINIDSQWFEENLLKMFGAPRYIRCLSFLLKLS